MKKKTILMTTISCLVSLVPLFIGLLLWDKLPEQMATSFDINGEVSGYSSRFFAVVGLPAFLVLCNLICIIFVLSDPKRRNISNKVLGVVLAIIPISAIFCTALIYKDYLGIKINVETFGPIFTGIIFIIIGLILPKCKQNYTVGIKLPWTLNSEDNWNKTHAFGGKVWLIGGILMTIAGLLGFEYISFAGIFVLAIIPVVYSYVYYRKHESK